MFGQNTYKTMVMNVIEGVLLKEATIKNYRCLSYGRRDDNGKMFYHALRIVFTDKSGHDECKTEYEGTDAKECADAIIKICGMFDAMSLALKWQAQHPNG